MDDIEYKIKIAETKKIHESLLFFLFEETFSEKYGKFVAWFSFTYKQDIFKEFEKKVWNILDKPSRFPQYKDKLIELNLWK